MEIRRVGVDGFEEIFPLLADFNNPHMSKDDWRQMLFTYPWQSESRHGFGYYADGKVVGFMGAIFSTRQVGGRPERFCNLSTWIVKKEFRGTSILLTRRLMDELVGHTLVGFTPAPTTCAVFSRLGFVPLESEQLLLFPLGGPRDLWGAMQGSFAVSPGKVASGLAGAGAGEQSKDATIHKDLASCRRIHHILLTRGGRRCYIVARRETRKRLPVAELLYISDREFFWNNRLLAHAGLFRATGTPVLAVDGRFADPRQGHHKLAVKVPRQRIYRPSRPEIGVTDIDGLYSELMILRE